MIILAEVITGSRGRTATEADCAEHGNREAACGLIVAETEAKAEGPMEHC